MLEFAGSLPLCHGARLSHLARSLDVICIIDLDLDRQVDRYRDI